MATLKHKDFMLADRFLRSDDAAGEELYANIYHSVKAYIFSHNNAQYLSEQSKEDVFSNALETSINKLDRYNGNSSFFTYVCGIAKLKILEKVKETARESKIENKIIELTETKSIYDDPLDILIEKELYEAVAKAQFMLSPEHRDVMRLRLNGMTARQISTQFDFTEDAVNSMFARAIKAFKMNFKNIY